MYLKIRRYKIRKSRIYNIVKLKINNKENLIIYQSKIWVYRPIARSGTYPLKSK
jgi:hypothetical protein